MADEAKTRTGATTDDGKRRLTPPRTAATDKPPTKTYSTPSSTDTAQAQTAASESIAKSQPTPKPPPEASPRNGVAVNVSSVTAAFHAGARSRSVRGIQLALTERGFAPGNVDGLVDYDTRAAYAKFQRDVGERATGIPTADSLDILGFDVVG